ncbi:MAG: urease accessory protein UreE [Rhodoblastus sp.]
MSVRATEVRAAGSWREEAADTVVLDFDDRHRRRIAMKGIRGLEFTLDLPDAVMLRSGDALALEDGRLVEVLSAPEPLLEIAARDQKHLVRVAWHLGNRHLPTQIMGAKLRIRRDHVIADMARGLGAEVREIEAPFDPEGGAYAQHVATHGREHHDHEHHDHEHHAHDHGHGHRHDHGHHHGHDHHDHDHCGCGHDHHDHAHKHG